MERQERTINPRTVYNSVARDVGGRWGKVS